MQSEREEEETYQEAVSSLPTRRVLWQILEAGGIFRTTLVIGSPDQTAFNEGRRSMALEVLGRLERYCPGSLEQMKAEAQYELEMADPKAARSRRRSRLSTGSGSSSGPGPGSGPRPGPGLGSGTSSGTGTDFDPYGSGDAPDEPAAE